MEGPLLSGEASPAADAGLLRPPLPRRRDQFHLLSHSSGPQHSGHGETGRGARGVRGQGPPGHDPFPQQVRPSPPPLSRGDRAAARGGSPRLRPGAVPLLVQGVLRERRVSAARGRRPGARSGRGGVSPRQLDHRGHLCSPEKSWPRLLHRGRAAAAESPPRPSCASPPPPPTCASTAGTARSGGSMRRPGNATTICTRRRSSPSGCHASDPSPPEPTPASSSSTITPAARRSQTPPCWHPFSPSAPEVFVGIRRALLPRGSCSDSVLAGYGMHLLRKERHRWSSERC